MKQNINLIGKEIRVIYSKNKENSKLQGKVVDETKNTITIDVCNKRKTLLKDIIEIMIKGNEKIVGKKIKKDLVSRLKEK